MKTKRMALLAATLVAAFSVMSGAAYAGSAGPTTFAKGQSDPTPQIIGGRPATEAYPFMASIQYKDPSRPNTHRCGAALVNPKWLVTAAHCIARLDGTLFLPSDYVIRIGSTDHLAGTIYQIEKFVAHPYWGTGHERISDIGLIKLKQAAPQPFIESEGIRPPSPGTPVRMIGWGRTIDGDPNSIPRQLQELDSTILPYQDCIHGDPYDITPGDLCVNDPGGTANICSGDSGSPLLVKVKGFWQLAGVASRTPGETGCLNGPGVYTSSDSNWHWIQLITMDDHRTTAATNSRR